MKNEKKIAYKGFDKDLKCRGFQYEVGKDYDLPEDPVLCENGFHACDNPLDVLRYYPPCGVDGTPNRYCIVEQSCKMVVGCDKTASSHIHISAEIGLDGLIDAGVKSILDVARKSDRIATNTGDYSAAMNTGYHSAAIVTGKESVAIVTGVNGRAKGTLGCWLVLTERDEWNGTSWPILGMQAVKVDGKRIEPDTYYMLVKNKVVKCKD